ncbi:putative glycoside hydrolase [Agaribacter flavus]|uniref:Glycoside hydrolase n=1 Tax=Agaribacter flavus TaxID=1902781 RepID=A0ABV7FS43_9ALTE
MRLLKKVSLCSLFLVVGMAQASTTPILADGKAVSPYELSLSFGKKVITDKKQKTAKGSLIATPFTEDEVSGVRFKWRPRGVKNQWGSADTNVHTITVINRQMHANLGDNYQSKALNIRTKVLRKPDELVELTMECKWDWKCRASVQLKSVLSRLPVGEWSNVTIPMACFDQSKIDLSAVTTPFMLHTSGKMELEISSVEVITLSQAVNQC